MGRKKKDRTDRVIIAFEVTESMKDRLEQEAAERLMSVSAIIREKVMKSYEDRI